MMKSFRNKNGFTLIELLVVIGILGILVLLAAPKFLGYTKDAKLVQVQNDIRAVENSIAAERIVNDDYIDGWETVDKADLEEYKDSRLLYDKKGSVKNSEELNDEYFKVNSNLVKSKLKGDFILAKGGNVYYHDKNGVKSENEGDNEVVEEVIDESKWAPEDDFEWVSIKLILDMGLMERPKGAYDKEDDVGYFKYIGTDKIVDIPHVIQGVNMTSYHRMFEGSSVEKVISTNKNIEDISEMFANSKATSLDITELNTSNVNNMQSTFAALNAEINGLKNLDTSNVTNMSLTFSGWQKDELDISGWNTKKVENMSGMFGAGGIYTSVNNSHYHRKEPALKRIVLGSGWNTESVKYMDNIFTESKIENPHEILKDWDLSGLVSTQGLFQFNGSYYKGNVTNHSLNMNDYNINYNKITSMNNMFADSDIKNIEFGHKFNTSNVTDMSAMFRKSKVETLDLSSFDTSNAIYMTSMFSESEALTLDLSSFDTRNVKYMSWMFKNSKATTLNLSSFNTIKLESMDWMFEEVQAKDLDLRSFDTSKVTAMSHLFKDSKIERVYVSSQNELNRLRNTGSKPTGIRFEVK